DRRPDRVDVLLDDAMAAQKVAGGIGAVDLETLVGAAVPAGQAHVVEHRARIKQGGGEPEPSAFARECGPVIDAAGMVKQEGWFGVPHQLRYFAGELAVGRTYSVNGECHSTSPAGYSPKITHSVSVGVRCLPRTWPGFPNRTADPWL